MKKQYENGVHDISNEEYHASAGLSRSALWEFKQSPKHYWHKYLNPEAKQVKKSNIHYALGELVHCLVLEPAQAANRYAVQVDLVDVPKVGLLKDVGRDVYEEQKKCREMVIAANETLSKSFEQKARNKEIVTQAQFTLANDMAIAALSNEIAPSLFQGSKVEQSIYFTHEATGLQCKVRPDAWKDTLVTDLKTVKDGTYRAFQNSAYSYGYFLQAAMIKAALASLDIELQKFLFYCVEKEEPYACAYYLLDEEAMDYGTNQFDTLMEKFARCLQSDTWESYEPQMLYLPNYATYEE